MLSNSIMILGQIVLIILGLFSTYIIFYFMSSLERNIYHKKYVYLIAYIVFTMVIIMAQVFGGSFITLCIDIIFTAIFGHFLYNNKKVYLLYYSAFIVLLGCFQLIIVFLFGQVCQMLSVNFYTDGTFLMAASLVRQIANLSAARIAIAFYKRKNIEIITKVQFFNFLILPIFSVFYITTLIMYVQTYISINDTILIIANIASIIVLNVYITNIFEAISNNNKLRNQLMIYNEQARMQYEYYNNLENKYKNSRKIIHDIKNHMQTIEELYEQKETEKAKNYAEDMYRMFDKFVQKYYTSNKVLNIIINDKFSKAEQFGIAMKCKIGDVNLEFIKDIDLTAIFSNLLDNAIDGTKTELQNRSIFLNVDKFNEFVVINIINSTDKEPIKINKRFKSTKKNHEGLGIENVNMVLGKYEGNMRVEYKDKFFKVNIVIPIR